MHRDRKSATKSVPVCSKQGFPDEHVHTWISSFGIIVQNTSADKDEVLADTILNDATSPNGSVVRFT